MSVINSYAVLYILAFVLSAMVRCIRTQWKTEKHCVSKHGQLFISDIICGLHFLYTAFFTPRDENYLETTHRTFEESGSTYSVKRWTWETIFTRDSKNIKHILAEDFKSFELPRVRVNAMKPLLGNGIFSLNGTSWSHARSILKPCFANRDKEGTLAMLEHHFQAFEQRIHGKQQVDLQPLFFCLAMDFATEYLTGTSSSMLSSEKSNLEAEQFVADYMTCSEEVVAKMSLGPLQHFRLSISAMLAKRRIFKFIDKFIQEAQENQQGRQEMACNVLHELSSVTTDPKVLRDQMLHILVASRDTIASLLSNLFFMLTRHPQVYSKLRVSVIDKIGHKLPTANDLKQMEYLKWCIQESLRLHPVIPTNAREASKDCLLPRGGGEDGEAPLLVKKGTVVMYNVYSMHRDVSIFGESPERFIPERWDSLRPGWGYLPFNGGPRICLGQQLALLKTQYLVTRMVQKFEFLQACDTDEWTELFALATTCKNGVHVKLTA